jgi:hypothetical protein
MSYNASNIGKVLYALLNSTVATHPLIAPQNTQTPYLIYSILSIDPDDTKQTTSMADTVTVLLMVYEDTIGGAATRANSIRTILDGYAGTSGGVTVNSITYVNESDDYDEELMKYIKIQEYNIRINNT